RVKQVLGALEVPRTVGQVKQYETGQRTEQRGIAIKEVFKAAEGKCALVDIAERETAILINDDGKLLGEAHPTGARQDGLAETDCLSEVVYLRWFRVKQCLTEGAEDKVQDNTAAVSRRI